MDCIDFSTNQVMRPFGAAKGKARPVAPRRDTRAIIKIPAPPKFAPQPPRGGVQLIPRVSPAFPNPRTNPYTDNPRGLKFF
jgi:hypothetical protein